MKFKVKLDDYGAKELKSLVNKNNPDIVLRARDRQISSDKIQTNSHLDMTFESTGGARNWRQIVRFYPIYNGEIKGEMDLLDFKDVLRNADVGVYCDCPHFEYSGAAYHASKEDYNIVEESRRPERNKKNTMLCKHAYNAISVVTRNMDKIAERYYGIMLKHNRITEPKVEVDLPEPVIDEPEIIQEPNINEPII